MPSLNTNVASLYASRNLMTAQSKMADSVERLSSGLRINRAKDDAAGLGISNALSSQINGANQGIRNINDGISIVQTAEGAINEASDMAQRILTLATQAKNGTMSSNDRKSIVNEMQALVSSINSMASRTKFGDKELLTVSTGATATASKFEIAASASSSDTITLTNNAFFNIGSGATATTEVTTFTLTSDLVAGQSLTIGGRKITAGSAGATKAQIAEAFVTGVDVGTNNAVVTTSGGTGATLTTPWTVSKVANDYSDGKIVFTSTTTNTNIANDITSTAASFSTIGNPGYTYSTVQGGSQSDGQASFLNGAITTFLNDLNANAVESTIQIDVTAIQDRANEYIALLNTQRSKLGAFQNQLESSANNVSDLSVNLSAARSRVQDTDYAQETASLTKGQILQQAATAMLAQANQMPNVILSLLK
jgi:flagellin